jgi:putative transposase
MRRFGMRERGDERILGSGDFVEHLIEQAARKIKHQLATEDLVKRAEKEILVVCEREHIEAGVLRSGSRRRTVSRARSHLALRLVEEMGLTLAEAARQLGLSTSAIAHILKRKQ